MSSSAKKYWAFISYRHSDNKELDRDWASWLHKSIETYDVPAELIGTKNDHGDIIPDRIYPVFRDEESLPANSNLDDSITAALNNSRFLVALCSPRAVESKYVAQEIEHFKNTDKGDRIIGGIIAGEPGHPINECFPEPIRKIANKNGEHIEPIAADFRLLDGSEGYTSAESYKKLILKNLPKKEALKKADQYEERLQLMKLKIIAGILGVPLETIRDRDKAYQLLKAKKRQKVLVSVITAISLLAIAAGYFGYLNEKNAELAEEQRDNAQEKETQARKNLARSDFLLAYENWQKRSYKTSLAYLTRSLQNNPKDIEAAQFAWSIVNRGGVYFPNQCVAFDNSLIGGVFSKTADSVTAIDNSGSVFAKDIVTGNQKEIIQFKLPKDEDAYLVAAKSSDSQRLNILTENNSIAIDTETFKPFQIDQDKKSESLESLKIDEILEEFESTEELESDKIVDGYATDGVLTILDIPSNHQENFSKYFKQSKGNDIILKSVSTSRFGSTLILLNEKQFGWLDGRPVYKYHYAKSQQVLFIEREGYYGSNSIEALIMGADKPFVVDLFTTSPGDPMTLALSADHNYFAIQRGSEVTVMQTASLKKWQGFEKGNGRRGYDDFVQNSEGIISVSGELLDLSNVNNDKMGKLLTTTGVFEFNLQSISIDREWQVGNPKNYEETTFYSISGEFAITSYGKNKSISKIKTSNFPTNANDSVTFHAKDYPFIKDLTYDNRLAADGSWFMGTNLESANIVDQDSYKIYLFDINKKKVINYSTHTRQELLWVSDSESWMLRARRINKESYKIELFTDIKDKDSLITILLPKKITAAPDISVTDSHIYLSSNSDLIEIPIQHPAQFRMLSLQEFQQLYENLEIKYDQTQQIFVHVPNNLTESKAMNATGLRDDVFAPIYNTLHKGHKGLKYCEISSDWAARGSEGRLIILSDDQSRVLDHGYSGMSTTMSENGDAAVSLSNERPAMIWCPTPRDLNHYTMLPELLQHFSGCTLDPNGNLLNIGSQSIMNSKISTPCRSWKQLAKLLGFQN
ncbi:toll/interleukin-1 receptor domain-containing protein [Verrucomicrobiaceae bacterium 5K15]|uniref:Toll/interleukin-1 receptor domain-containing protein n=1 Tax=Oceaniferula flava TaxID=2800421 RepID=A0AAE2SCE5_9BACT|nr:toll/interleukin-1 receptor domain-containing protein [Oceaniferula flavus]MBK1855631.1 toll/interleukin-1 receptor domain-containing protein [Oceaniferula flavus]MBM1136937.1 toll/interleukin-1 receptor domain-containing protein [Oceaniferula flavus]